MNQVNIPYYYYITYSSCIQNGSGLETVYNYRILLSLVSVEYSVIVSILLYLQDLCKDLTTISWLTIKLNGDCFFHFLAMATKFSFIRWPVKRGLERVRRLCKNYEVKRIESQESSCITYNKARLSVLELFAYSHIIVL